VPLTGLLGRIVDLRTGARLLAATRIIIATNAALAALEAWRMLSRVLKPGIVEIPFLPWLPRFPSSALPYFIAAWLVAALLLALGWRTRIAGAALTLIAGYTLFLDQQTYSNHLYLLFLILFLLMLSDSGAALSLDARRQGTRSDVAAWPVLLLKIEATIVYVFSALAKITPAYLSGEVLTRSLKREGWLAVPATWLSPATMSVLATTSIVAELFIGVGLWSRRLRRFAILAGAGFHLGILATVDSSRLSLAIFALDLFAVYPLFLDADERRPRISACALSFSAGETAGPGNTRTADTGARESPGRRRPLASRGGADSSTSRPTHVEPEG
jgi:vitamin K-dependent gamma-carboxylase-like protein